MGKVEYNWLEGMGQIQAAGERLDPRWVEVIAYHAALETQLNVMLEKSLPRGSAVTGSNPRFGFGHKVAILKAAWKGEAADADKICAILYRFNELRNAVAHPDRRKTRTEIRNLIATYRALVPDLDHKPDFLEIAQGVCAYMGDGIAPHHLKQIAVGISEVIKGFAAIIKPMVEAKTAASQE